MVYPVAMFTNSEQYTIELREVDRLEGQNPTIPIRNTVRMMIRRNDCKKLQARRFTSGIAGSKLRKLRS
jgi:hypothetical protein